jgi:SAM-dependent methyltransferase
MPSNDEVLKRWSGAAPFWEKRREQVRHMFAPVTYALVDAARIGNGDSVLDVATGPGEPALSIAEVVGSGGMVKGVDAVVEMIQGARRAAEHLGLRNAQFETASIERLPFADGTYDAAVSRFGAMFFPSPVDGVREILRVLKPGARFALAVWREAERNAFFWVLTRALAAYVTFPPPEPDAMDAFRFAVPGALRSIVSEAGALEVEERALDFTMDVPMPAEEFWTLRLELSEALREKAEALPPEDLESARRLAVAAFREYESDGRLRLPAQVLIVTGRKG